jgi:hypothetical protein
MGTTPTTITSTNEEPLLQRARSFFGVVFFLLLQRSPRLLQLHRNEHSWTVFRVALGLFGAALVVLPLGLWKGWITAIFGLLLFVTAVLLPPAMTESDTDRRARDLGAHTVVSGGEYRTGNAPPTHARLFISPVQIWALDKHFDPLVVVHTAEISSLWIEPSGDRWLLQIRWTNQRAEFSFGGFFAERFARLAEESIRAAAPARQPVMTKSRSAGA